MNVYDPDADPHQHVHGELCSGSSKDRVRSPHPHPPAVHWECLEGQWAGSPTSSGYPSTTNAMLLLLELLVLSY